MSELNIKPLEWEDMASYSSARTRAGVCTVNQYSWALETFDGVYTGACSSIEDGKRKCEVHWDKLVRSFLQTTTDR